MHNLQRAYYHHNEQLTSYPAMSMPSCCRKYKYYEDAIKFYLYEGRVHEGSKRNCELNLSSISVFVSGQIFNPEALRPQGASLGRPESCEAICLNVMSLLMVLIITA